MFLRSLIVFCVVGFVGSSQANEWQPLLDADLSRWEVFTGVPHKSVVVPGASEPSTSENGQDGTPVGVGDPLDIYTTSMVDGEVVLHVSGQVYAGLTSLEEFENYHLSLEYRWGEKKWPPRLNQKRDSGLLLHCVGKHGSFWNVWMSSLECQVQEGDTGDFIGLAGTGADIRCAKPEGGGRAVWDPIAPLYSNAGYVSHGPSEEAPNGKWNTVEVYTVGDRMAFVVNGTPNMVLFRTRHGWGKNSQPLTRGKLQIQSEAAAIDYRRIKLRPISAFPESLAELITVPVEDAKRF